MVRQHEPLVFELSDADLKAALDLLRGRTPKDPYREAWIVLTVELERRRLREPPVPVQLARETFDRLPPDVQALMSRARSLSR